MSRAEAGPASLYHRVVVYLLFAILVLPLVGTFIYSIASSWSATILPAGFTVKWYVQLWSDPRFLMAFGQSLLVCVGALILSVVLILPLLFVVHYHFPKLDALMNILILLPFAVPPVVSSVGLLQLYGSGPMAMVGTPWILIGCYFTVALPFMYRAITNNLQAINLRDLMDAAQLLGASTWQAAILVVLPNLRKGLMVRRVRVRQHPGGHPLRNPAGVPQQHAQQQRPFHQRRGHFLLLLCAGTDLGRHLLEQGQKPMSFVSVQHLQKSYAGTPVFSDINCDIAQGEFVTLLGPSGCGKSTLLRCIAGLTAVDSGKILLDGQDIVPLSPQRRNIGMVFQSYALFPNMTVEQNVAFGLRMQKVNADDSRRRVQEVLQLVELTELAGRYPHQMSGGQCQRVALARSLVTRPRLLLLDEPLSALDARIRKHLREQIREIQRELGLTTIFVTHDQEEALTMSDRIFLMNQGKIVQSGDAETLYTAPVDVFAAGFIGNYNLLDADKASRLLQRPISGRIAIRPEAIELSRNGELDAQVRSHSLLGNVIRYRIEARGVELVVDVLNRSADDLHPDGQRLALSIDPSALCEVA
jgi:putative spermidine/putrescine transport system ATP-binding protein